MEGGYPFDSHEDNMYTVHPRKCLTAGSPENGIFPAGVLNLEVSLVWIQQKSELTKSE